MRPRRWQATYWTNGFAPRPRKRCLRVEDEGISCNVCFFTLAGREEDTDDAPVLTFFAETLIIKTKNWTFLWKKIFDFICLQHLCAGKQSCRDDPPPSWIREKPSWQTGENETFFETTDTIPDLGSLDESVWQWWGNKDHNNKQILQRSPLGVLQIIEQSVIVPHDAALLVGPEKNTNGERNLFFLILAPNAHLVYE